MTITDIELKIFARQIILKELSEKNFEQIQSQNVILIGMGGIGCPVAKYLVSSGIKNLTLIDHDIINISNLNRQILFSFKDIGKKKVTIAKKNLRGINPKCKINIFSQKLKKMNIKKYIKKPTIVIDTTDDWKTMNEVNKYCLKNSIPLISASVIGFDGQVMLFKNNKKDHLCLNCVFPNSSEETLPRCETVGVTSIACGFIGLITAQMVLNFFTNIKILESKIITIKTKTMEINHIKIKKNNNCSNIN